MKLIVQKDSEALKAWSFTGNVIQSIFMMPRISLKSFSRAPEVLVMDCTYNTNRFNRPVMIVSSVTQENHWYPLAYGWLETENTSTFDWFIDRFVDAIGPANLEGVRVVLTDGEQAYNAVLKQYFPRAKQQRLDAHTVASMRRNSYSYLHV